MPPPPLHPDILWFVRLGIDQGFFTRAQCVKVKVELGNQPGMLDFAQKLIDDEIVTDVEMLEKLAGRASIKAKVGPPATDPFVAADDFVEDIVAVAQKKAVAGPPPSFAFEAIGKMDEKQLAQGLRDLLTATVLHGASDLHMCTGRRPFVRKDRALAFINEHSLTADEALRLNTALLSPTERTEFLEKKDLDYALALGPNEQMCIRDR